MTRLLRAHPWQNRPDHGERPEEVRLEISRHLFLGEFLQRSSHRIARVVHEHVDASKGIHRALYRGTHLRRIGHIQSGRAAPVRELSGEVREDRGGAGGGHHAVAGVEDRFGKRAPESA